MKNLTLELANDIFNDFTLSVEEMIYVKGGNSEGDPITLPSKPPVKI